MKLFKILIGVVAGLIFLSYLNRPPEQASAPMVARNAEANQFNNQAVEKATAAIKAESKVKDMHYDGAATVQWNVGVLPDGTRRHGYASYICEIIRENQALHPSRDTLVRIVDITAVVRGQHFREANLGTVNCETYQVVR